jgi:hypothetical protein
MLERDQFILGMHEAGVKGELPHDSYHITLKTSLL